LLFQFLGLVGINHPLGIIPALTGRYGKVPGLD